MPMSSRVEARPASRGESSASGAGLDSAVQTRSENSKVARTANSSPTMKPRPWRREQFPEGITRRRHPEQSCGLSHRCIGCCIGSVEATIAPRLNSSHLIACFREELGVWRKSVSNARVCCAGRNVRMMRSTQSQGMLAQEFTANRRQIRRFPSTRCRRPGQGFLRGFSLDDSAPLSGASVFCRDLPQNQHGPSRRPRREARVCSRHSSPISPPGGEALRMPPRRCRCACGP